MSKVQMEAKAFADRAIAGVRRKGTHRQMAADFEHQKIPWVPCETCGEPTTFTGTKRCDGCREVEKRLADYLRNGGAKARKFVGKVLAEELLVVQADTSMVQTLLEVSKTLKEST